MWIFELAAIAELIFVLLEVTMYPAALPLGGGHAQQIGILFGYAFVLSEVSSRCRSLYARTARRIRRARSEKSNGK